MLALEHISKHALRDRCVTADGLEPAGRTLHAPVLTVTVIG
jgi:hypothetical protein